MNIDLRKENPVDNVNRILAVESLVKYYPIELVEETDHRVVHSWTELDEQEQEREVKQIDLAYCLFGLPTVELKHLMEKLSKKVLKDNIIPEGEDAGTDIEDQNLKAQQIRDMIMNPDPKL